MIKQAPWRLARLALLVPTSVWVVLLGADPWHRGWWLGTRMDEVLLAGSMLIPRVNAAPDPKRRILLHCYAYNSPCGDRIHLLLLLQAH